MQTKRTSAAFLVDGVKCELAIDEKAISWWPSSSAPASSSSTSATTTNSSDSSNKRRIKSLDFSQVIGIKSAFKKHEQSKFALNNGTGRLGYGSPVRLASTTGRSRSRKIKIYYVKQNEHKSAGQLLKLKKLSIEWQPGNSSNMTATTAVVRSEVLADEQAMEAAGKQCESSEPPSCYASDGSNSQLSSLSQLTTATTTSVNFGSESSRSSTATTTSSSPVEPQLFPSAAELCRSLQVDNGRNVVKISDEFDKLVRLLEVAIERQRRRSSRPQRLLVFVNPFGGKGKAVHLYKLQVRRLFELANVEVKLVVTKYANHARDTIEDPMFNVEYFDGIVCVGGDGMFSELMNGLLFRYNRDALLKAEARRLNSTSPTNSDSGESSTETAPNAEETKADGNSKQSMMRGDVALDKAEQTTTNGINNQEDQRRQLDRLRVALGGIGQQFVSPPVPLGVIGAGSTDANSFGLIGTNDVITATLNIILGNQINIDVCSIHTLDEDRLLRFVSTFVAYGYFGDVIRESEKLRWLGPSRYDVTGVNTLMKNRTYKGLVKILVSSQDSSPSQGGRCCAGCQLCQLSNNGSRTNQPAHCEDDELTVGHDDEPRLVHDSTDDQLGELSFVEKRGPFVGVNAAVTACRCPQTKKGFSPNNHLANGCADLILVHPCTRLQYIQYLMRTAGTKKSAFDLKYVEAYRCRQFEFVAQRQQQVSSGAITKSGGSLSSGATSSTNSIDQSTDGGSSTNKDKEMGGQRHQQTLVSSWNADGEILDEQSVRVKVNNQLLRVFGTGGS